MTWLSWLFNEDLDRESLREHLIDEESWETRPYKDHLGNVTVGVGRVVWTNKDTPGRQFTEEEVSLMLDNDMDDVISRASSLDYYAELSAVRKLVVCAMCFQLGFVGFLGFKETNKALRAGDWERAADEMLNSKWAREDSPGRAKRLAQMMRDG